ncbi:MAG TPA: alkaline phosphatase family protein [Streptosporangiaceae bacterium]
MPDFYTTLADGDMPAVSFLKAAEYQDGHPGYSDPLDEQSFLVNTINQIEESKYWKSTAIVITWDDSDGWYDHQVMPIVNGSATSADTAFCSSAPVTLDSWPDRCGLGQRLPMLVISPWTRQNYVSHNLTNTASIVTSSRTTGSADSGSARAPSTPSRAACTRGAVCSTSTPGRTSGPSSSTRPPARWSAASRAAMRNAPRRRAGTAGQAPLPVREN